MVSGVSEPIFDKKGRNFGIMFPYRELKNKVCCEIFVKYSM